MCGVYVHVELGVSATLNARHLNSETGVFGTRVCVARKADVAAWDTMCHWRVAASRWLWAAPKIIGGKF